MIAFDVLGDPVRRRILELLAGGEMASGAVVDVIHGEFGISQPAVSQHLKVLRDSGIRARAGRRRPARLRARGRRARRSRGVDRTGAVGVDAPARRPGHGSRARHAAACDPLALSRGAIVYPSAWIASA
jgi:DNA-binding transcriptional ArsR family regulator